MRSFRQSVVCAVAVIVLGSCTDETARTEPPSPMDQSSGDPAAAPTSPRVALVPDEAFMDLCEMRGEQGGDLRCDAQTQIVEGLAARPLRLPDLPATAQCPTSSGNWLRTSSFGVIALGRKRPVQPGVAVAHPRLALDGRLTLTPRSGDWWYVKTLWFAQASYQGPFLIRGARLDRDGVVRFGASPTASMIAIRGATANGAGGFREVPGGTFVRAPGCYGWQVDGPGFSYRIIFKAITQVQSK